MKSITLDIRRSMPKVKYEKYTNSMFIYLVVAFTGLWVTILTYVTRLYFVDDAFIGFHYLDNVYHGYGFVFNKGEQIEGVTNIGWLLFILPLGYIIPITVAAKIVNLLCIIGILGLCYRISLRIIGNGENPSYAIWIIPLIVTSYEFLYFGLAGMETFFLAFLLCLMLYWSMEDRQRWGRAIIGSYVFLVHPEAVLVYPLLILFTCGCHWNRWKSCMGPLLLFIVLLSGYELLRYWYFGEFVPNTFKAKTTTIRTIVANAYYLLAGENLNVTSIFRGVPVAIVLIRGGVTFGNRCRIGMKCAIAIVLTGFLFALYAHVDWSEHDRYFAPFVPVTYIILWRGLLDIGSQIAKGAKLHHIAALCAVALILFQVVFTAKSLRTKELERYPWYVLTSKNLIPTGKWIRDHLPEDAVIATDTIGAVSYYGKRYIWDYSFGLTNKNIAVLRANYGGKAFRIDAPEIESEWKKVAPRFALLNFITHPDGQGSIPVPHERTIYGIKYRLCKSWPVSYSADWVLWENMEL